MPEPDAGAQPPGAEPFRLGPHGTSAVRAAAARAAELLLGLDRLQRYYDGRPPGCDVSGFLEWSFRALSIRVEVSDDELQRVPLSGPALVVANHPFGGIEGMALGRVLRSRRPDVKILANYALGRIPELGELFLLVDPFDTRDSHRRNIAPLRRALGWLRAGGMLVVFPAGEVAHLDLRRLAVEDPPWNGSVAALVRHAECPVVPVFFEGRNRLWFQLSGLVHPRLRTALLVRALLARRGTTIRPRIGGPIPFRQLEPHDDAGLTAYLRLRTFILRERAPRPPAGAGPVQPRVTPRRVAPIVAPTPEAALAREVERLPPHQLLVDAGAEAVYVAEADQIPAVLREIGRLREVTFRAAGEGTGRELDLDEFDGPYRHLFLWSRRAREIVGAYRVGLSEERLRERGLSGLYTSTLFEFKPRLFEQMGPALEMGRSFVRLEHQKSYAALLLLWKGIGRFVLGDPRYATLFGPVSISAEYQSASQQLIVAFLEQNRFVHDWSRWVRPRAPCRRDLSRGFGPGLGSLRDLDDVSAFIAEIEADQKGVPILLKQYLRLGGRLLGFNVDPEFSNVLDVLIMVDLRRTEPKILERYMGRDGARTFFSHHAQPAAG